jgi:hypothetical protein
MTDDQDCEGRPEVCKLTRRRCPKAARRWLLKLGIVMPRGRWIVDRGVYRERMKAMSEGRLEIVLKTLKSHK